MKKCLSFLFILFTAGKLLAFDYLFALREKDFSDFKINFRIKQVLDGRMDKTKAVGTLPAAGLSFGTVTVGNDSLGEQMTAFFRTHADIFSGDMNILLVVNQVNMRFVRGFTEAGGKKEELEVTLSYDYYLEQDKTYGLLYQQFYKYRENVTFINKASKAINIAFSEATIAAFLGFKNQITAFKPLVRREFAKDSLLQFLKTHPQQIVNNKNIKDGLYFSSKDIYLNNPAPIAAYTLADTAALAIKPVVIKASGYMADRAYAIVRRGRIFIYILYGNYKEAVLADDGSLYFPDVTQSSVLGGARAASAGVGIVNAFFPLGGLVTAAIQDGIKDAGTKTRTSDIKIDYDTGDLIPVKK